MDIQQILDAVEQAPNPETTHSLIREFRGIEGASSAYFARLQNAFGSDPARAKRLAAHWRLVLRFGDDPALAYRAKGALERLSGRWLESARAFRRAGALAVSPVDQLSFQAGAIDGYAHAGRVSTAVELGRKLAKGLDALGAVAQAGRVRLNLGHALLWVDRYGEARRWLTAALHDLRAGGLEAESVYALLSLSTAELYGGSPIEARSLALQAMENANGLGLTYAALLAELNAGQASLMQGRCDEALEVFLRLRPLLSASPHDHARVAEFLGDAYLRLNLWPESIDAYDEAISLSRNMPVLNVAASHLGKGQASIASGNAEAAITDIAKARRLFRKAGNHPWTLACDTWMAKALFLSGRESAAAKLIARAVVQASRLKSPWHEAEALLTKLRIVPADNAADLRRVTQIVNRNGYASLAWRVQALRAKQSPGRLRLSAYRKAFAEILASRALTESQVSRVAYLRDKTEVIQSYLAILLSKPTPKRVEEAIDAISRSRSAALLDEILTGSAGSFRPQDLARIEELRLEFQSLESEAHFTNGSRRVPLASGQFASLQRRWIEATHQYLLPLGNSQPATAKSAVLALADDQYYCLAGGRASKLGISSRELEHEMRWLRFELLAPIADPDADTEAACSAIHRLASKFGAVLRPNAAGVIPICPEDQLWQVPWTTCVAAIDSRCEAILAIHPAFCDTHQNQVGRDSKTMLWVDSAENLYHAEGEALSFLERFPDSRVCRSAKEVRESLADDVSLLHVICHARHNPNNPMFSALQFRDGPIYATELARSGLKAELVTLSACDTGNFSAVIRNEPDGLARSFLARGARSVIGSMWPLDDEAAARMYDVFFACLATGSNAIEALNRARNETRTWRKHPYYWGSLVLFGGYAR